MGQCKSLLSMYRERLSLQQREWQQWEGREYNIITTWERFILCLIGRRKCYITVQQMQCKTCAFSSEKHLLTWTFESVENIHKGSICSVLFVKQICFCFTNMPKFQVQMIKSDFRNTSLFLHAFHSSTLVPLYFLPLMYIMFDVFLFLKKPVAPHYLSVVFLWTSFIDCSRPAIHSPCCSSSFSFER